MNREEAIYEYEQMLLGKKSSIDSDIFCYNDLGNEKIAIEMFKYAFEKIMHWSPYDAYHNFNEKFAEILKLRHLVKYINFPPEFDPNTDFYYVAVRVYPDKIKVNLKERTLSMYEQLLSGEMKKFPKRFLEGRDGEMRAVFCLKYAIQNYGTFTSIEDLYRAFSEQEGIDFLKKMKLYQPCTILFDSPIEFLHSTFTSDDKLNNEFIYTIYKFRVYEKNLKKAKTAAAKATEFFDEKK